MGENFYWLYDIGLAAVVILCVFSCGKKGFSKTLILIAGCIIAVLLSSLISQKSSQSIYDTFVKRARIDSVGEALEDYNPAMGVKEAVEKENFGAVLDELRVKKLLQSDDSVEMLYEYTNQAAGDIVDTHENFINILTNNYAELFAKQIGIKLPPYVVRELTHKLSGNGEMFVEITKLLIKTPNKAPEYIEENFIREPALKLVRAFVFVISYFIIMMIIRVVVYRGVNFGLLNGYDRLDHFVGGLCGFVQAAAVVIIITVLVKIMIQIAESDGSMLSYETVDKTRIFKKIFNFVEKY